MKKKPEVYFQPTDYNKEGWLGLTIGDAKNSRKRSDNEKKKERLIAKNNIKLKKQ